jgi:hypothetical protein
MSDSEIPAINEDLIRRYFEAGDLKNLLSIFNFQQRCKNRAEELSRAYLAQMVVLGKTLDALREGLKPERPEKSEAKKPKSEALSKSQVLDI